MTQTCFQIKDFSGTFFEYQVLSTRTFVLSEIICWSWYSVLFQNSLKTKDLGLGTGLYFLGEVLTLPISVDKNILERDFQNIDFLILIY